MQEVIIIGGGPAGYTAGIYTGRAGLNPIIIGEQLGGQLMRTSKIENFPGYDGLAPKLMMNLKEQAIKYGAKIERDIVKAIFPVEKDYHFQVYTEKKTYTCNSIIIATGAEPNMLGLKNERSIYGGGGLSTCATCDAMFYKDKIVYVIGGGDTACEDALALAKYTNKVNVVVRGDKMVASKIMQDRVRENKNIKIYWNTECYELEIEEGKLKAIWVKTKKLGKYILSRYGVDGLFYAIGSRPTSQIFDLSLDRDNWEYIKTGYKDIPTMTSMDGVFACGDVVDYRYRQAIVAAGDGARAAIDCERWLNEQ